MEKVSIIIPVKNLEDNNLNTCLSSIEKQTYGQIETIIVSDENNFSEYEKLNKSFDFKFERSSFPGRSFARNKGIELAHGQNILFLDSDQELSENTVEECAKKIKNNDFLSIKELNLPKEFWSKVFNYEFQIWFWNTKRDIPRFFRTSIVKRIGGYDTSLEFGEDWDLAERAREISAREDFVSNTLITHHIRSDFLSVIKKHYKYGKYLNGLIKKHKSKTLVMYSGLNLRVFANMLKYFSKNPVYTSLAILTHFIKYLAVGAGYIAQKFYET